MTSSRISTRHNIHNAKRTSNVVKKETPFSMSEVCIAVGVHAEICLVQLFYEWRTMARMGYCKAGIHTAGRRCDPCFIPLTGVYRTVNSIANTDLPHSYLHKHTNSQGQSQHSRTCMSVCHLTAICNAPKLKCHLIMLRALHQIYTLLQQRLRTTSKQLHCCRKPFLYRRICLTCRETVFTILTYQKHPNYEIKECIKTPKQSVLTRCSSKILKYVAAVYFSNTAIKNYLSASCGCISKVYAGQIEDEALLETGQTCSQMRLTTPYFYY